MDELRIGKKILMLRKEKNITQEELALKVGISAGAVSKWENENSMPDISLIVPLARALDTTIDNLFSFERDISKNEVNKIKEELMTVFMKKGYEAGEIECRKYLNYINNSCLMLIILAEIYYKEGNTEKAFLNLDTCYKMQNLFKIHSEMTAYKYVEFNMKNGHKEEAAKWFKIYVEEVITAEYNYDNNPYFDSVILEIKYDMQKVIRKKRLQSIIDEEKFITLKGLENYEKAIIEAKSAIEQI